VNRASENSELSSRIAFITGAFVLVFLVLHINAFFVRSRFLESGKSMYEIVAETFANPWTDAFYLAALVFLGYHLKHGVQSAFQTFGLRTPRYRKLIDLVAVIFWLLIPAAFATLPVYFLWSHLTGGH
jgi:succinate dehydrogenase / fumarate reductase cytochrome b subunit